MVVDTSALVAILKVEPDASTLLSCLGNSGANRIATATLLEAQMVVISQLGEAGVPELELLLNRAPIQVVPFNADHMRWALHGWRHYGKGRHQAALNMGDCISYGLAKAMDAPLLFKGEDFQHTDVKVPA
ncbi:type II toxin-antitoxin system VapC family toxin [Synechococcus sp. LA31]|uniref:type II toxin-antitoxin system VapC family toxin n=1 Tax=Synechococcus sp. LA31 TaxID=2741953 RepID=UPI001BDD87C2|nr:type II toxin-antitoxin system VapC family toxin [Synechococcus sp. LA31]QVV67041.1 type II toxin-antitoxin system VapC family toxin [Synechococcus sp. LA31]